jgi:hypothetical protein
MSGKSKLRIRLGESWNVLLGMAVALVMMLLFLRMAVFVAGHGHHGF